MWFISWSIEDDSNRLWKYRSDKRKTRMSNSILLSHKVETIRNLCFHNTDIIFLNTRALLHNLIICLSIFVFIMIYRWNKDSSDNIQWRFIRQYTAEWNNIFGTNWSSYYTLKITSVKEWGAIVASPMLKRIQYNNDHRCGIMIVDMTQSLFPRMHCHLWFP